MTYRILVTTDFSENSKTGIRFAIQLASQRQAEIVFLHIVDAIRPAFWSHEKDQQFEAEEIADKKERLMKFVGKVYRQCGITPGQVGYDVSVGAPVDQLIVSYAREKHVDLICMSTRGAGLVRRLIGTHTSGVLSGSTIPVVVVPKEYRRKPVSKILYASDLKDLAYELEEIKKIAAPLNAATLVHHYAVNPLEQVRKSFRELSDRYAGPAVHFRLKAQNLENPLIETIKEDSRKAGASLIVMFNAQNRSWIDQLLDSSKSVDLTFDTPIPALVIHKRVDG